MFGCLCEPAECPFVENGRRRLYRPIKSAGRSWSLLPTLDSHITRIGIQGNSFKFFSRKCRNLEKSGRRKAPAFSMEEQTGSWGAQQTLEGNRGLAL